MLFTTPNQPCKGYLPLSSHRLTNQDHNACGNDAPEMVMISCLYVVPKSMATTTEWFEPAETTNPGSTFGSSL